jgi:tetratricopeptide (TPR) repeat protein
MAAGTPGYGFAAAAAILGISESRLRYWSQTGFVGPSLRTAGKQAYSFADLVGVKAAKELVDRGFSTAEIRTALEQVRAALPEADRPLDHLRVAFDGNELVVMDETKAFALSGQRVFAFGLGDLRERAAGWGTTPLAAAAAAPKPGETAYGCLQEGLALERAGKPDDAARAYNNALELDPGLAAAHANLGALAHARGAAGEARAAFEAALALDPEQPEARYNLAHLLLEAGEVELAAAELRRVLQQRPDFADAHFNLATALETLGGRKQAREHLLRYLELAAADPDEAHDQWTAEARARLQRLA